MARDYEKKLEAMRAYAKTPAGKASKARSQQRYLEKRMAGSTHHVLLINPKPLMKALANWK